MAGASSTCGICGVEVSTPGRDLVIGGETIAVGCVIDLDQHWADVVDHYRSLHPDAALPPRVW